MGEPKAPISMACKTGSVSGAVAVVEPPSTMVGSQVLSQNVEGLIKARLVALHTEMMEVRDLLRSSDMWNEKMDGLMAGVDIIFTKLDEFSDHLHWQDVLNDKLEFLVDLNTKFREVLDILYFRPETKRGTCSVESIDDNAEGPHPVWIEEGETRIGVAESHVGSSYLSMPMKVRILQTQKLKVTLIRKDNVSPPMDRLLKKVAEDRHIIEFERPPMP